MRIRTWPWLLVLVSFAGCFDLTVPPQPGVGPAGLVSGRLVWQRPGRLQLEAARGASVFILGTNLAATSTDDGRFLIDGLISDEGSLFIRFDGDGDGVYERQRAFRLRDLGAGRGRQLSIGEVVLGQSASVSGQVVRGDLTDPNGHFGTPVFVPGFPLAAVTRPDGVFLLEGLAEGSAQLAAVRTDYQAYLSSPLVLRGGEEFSLSRVSMAREVASVSGVLRGRVVDAEGTPLSGVTVSTSGARTVMTDASGAWRFSGLLVDRYDVTFTAPGRLPAALYNVLVAGPDEAVTPDVVLAQGQAAGVPSLVDQVAMSRDAGPSTDGGRPDGGAFDAGTDAGTDGGFVVGIGTPIPFTLTFPNGGIGVSGIVTPFQPGAVYSWSVTPGGVVMIGNPTSQNTGLTPLAIGPFRLDLNVTVGGTTIAAPFVNGIVVAPDAGVDAGPTLPPLAVRDAGVSALALWIECDGPFVPPIVGNVQSGANAVPAVISYNGVTRRLVAVFDAPRPLDSINFSAPNLQLMDGGFRQLSTMTFSTPSLAFGPALLLRDGGLSDFNAGVAYTPDGVVATGRFFDGASCNGCLIVSGPRGQDALVAASSSQAVPWRRTSGAGFTVQTWYAFGEAFSRQLTGTGWGPASSPPGPMFVDGPALRALSFNGNQLQLWNYNATWNAAEMFGPNASFALRKSSAVAQQPGGALYAQVIDDSGNVQVWTKQSSWQAMSPAAPSISGAMGGRIASTNAGLVMFVNTGSGSLLYRLPTAGTWSQIPFTSKPLDLVGRGSRAYLVSSSSSEQLEVWVVDPVSGALTSTVIAPSAPVRSAELAAADFGELAVAWSTEDAGVYELLISEIK